MYRKTHTYKWIAQVGFPMTGWYHAHTHGVTHIHTGNGMLGGLLVLPRANLVIPDLTNGYSEGERITREDPLPPERFGDPLIFLTDVQLDKNSQIGPDNEFDRINGREGNILLVNRQIFPTLTFRALARAADPATRGAVEVADQGRSPPHSPSWPSTPRHAFPHALRRGEIFLSASPACLLVYPR